MSDQPAASRFTPQNKTTHERLSTNTVGLVALADFRKRRAEVLEQQEREAREAAIAAVRVATAAPSSNNVPTPPDRSLTGTPNNAAAAATSGAASADNSEAEKHKKKKVKRTAAKALVSFGGDEEEDADFEAGVVLKSKKDKWKKPATAAAGDGEAVEADGDVSAGGGSGSEKDSLGKKKVTVNSSVGIVPRALTKAALRREAAEREALRKEFLLLQAAVKATEIAIPFVFYDGTNIPGGIVRVKKGDFVWVFLDKSRKVGAELGVGGDKLANARRAWARVGVDDLMLVRGSIIIPHHYEFYFFIMNKNVGPGNKRLFDYSAEAPPLDPISPPADTSSTTEQSDGSGSGSKKVLSDIRLLEGFSDDPTFTKVVDRRWYQRNKHIYPASVWQEFDPEKDYQKEIRRDTGGNAFFFSG
ncbi:XAP5, circadian clock regulator-domain-containing protein [Apodospora peruviana]|uniref:XAP5, circadian clock regulator-domain-containing protein n=1 Tax=Apodospora peruviana TaxID=516989 RepID=A0AAE0I3U9_9PEZI|nr:XAP5, circadian clock regulator-domain-containing protein [Apodospora peruviana]